MAPARAWPPELAAAWAAYAAALGRLPGAAADAEALRRELRPEPGDGWRAAVAVAAWAKFRPHALLARKARAAPAGGLGRLLERGRRDPWSPPDALLLARLDHLAGLAARADAALAALADADPATRLGRLGESVDLWPPAPAPVPDDWPGLRDYFLAGVTGAAREVLFIRLLPDDDFGERLHLEGPSPELRFCYQVLLEREPKSRPRLDPVTLRPLEAPDAADPTVRVPSDRPAGYVLGVERLAAPPAKPVWRVSSGPKAAAAQYPTKTADGWGWPAGVPLWQPGLRAEHSERPPGTVVSVEHAADTPAEALFTVSLGPTPSVASAAYGLYTLSADTAWRAALAPYLEGLWAGASLEDARLLALLDAVTSPESPVTAVNTEPALARLAGACGTTLLGGACYRRDADEAATGVRGVPVFRKLEPVGAVVRVRAFGLVAGGRVVRPAEVVVSAGPIPPGCAELEALAPAVPDPLRVEVKAALAKLRPAALHGYLELAAVELFQLYWGRVRPAWRPVDPDGAEGFRLALAQFLEGQFGMRPFEPGNVFDHPDGWVTLPPGCRVTGGRVVELLAPGLLDAAGGLRLPAHALAE